MKLWLWQSSKACWVNSGYQFPDAVYSASGAAEYAFEQGWVRDGDDHSFLVQVDERLFEFVIEKVTTRRPVRTVEPS